MDCKLSIHSMDFTMKTITYDMKEFCMDNACKWGWFSIGSGWSFARAVVECKTPPRPSAKSSPFSLVFAKILHAIIVLCLKIIWTIVTFPVPWCHDLHSITSEICTYTQTRGHVIYLWNQENVASWFIQFIYQINIYYYCKMQRKCWLRAMTFFVCLLTRFPVYRACHACCDINKYLITRMAGFENASSQLILSWFEAKTIQS